METAACCRVQTPLQVRRHPAVPTAPGLFLCHWLDAVFIHYSIDAETLQPYVPFKLDLLSGKAWVSLVAFTIDRLRPMIGGRLSELAFKPIARHYFLNVRTYVRWGDDCGIYFIKEWLSNSLSVLLGPCTYGLPYNSAKINYCNNSQTGFFAGTIEWQTARLDYGGRGKRPLRASKEHSRDAFLLERYIAFTQRKQKPMFFRVVHEPWLQRETETVVNDSGLLSQSFPWFQHAQLESSNYSPGVRDVRVSFPGFLSESKFQ